MSQTVHLFVEEILDGDGDDYLTDIIRVYADRADAERATLSRRDQDRMRGETSRLDILSYRVEPSAEGSTLIDRAWLATLRYWRPAYRAGDSPELTEDSRWWSGQTPFVAVRFLDEDDRPWLCVGTASAGWSEVAYPATRDDLRRLAAALNYPLKDAT